MRAPFERTEVYPMSYLSEHATKILLDPAPPQSTPVPFAELPGTVFPQYKYLKSQYAEKFFASGALRIGTIFDFADTTVHRVRVADSNEGSKNFWRPDGGRLAMLANLNCINAYTFCTSDVLSNEIAREFDADCAIEIRSIKFFHEISKQISLKHFEVFSTIGPISYLSNETVLDYFEDFVLSGGRLDQIESVAPGVARLKDPEFQSQCEVRAIWEPVTLAGKIWPSGRPIAASERTGLISPYERHYSPANEGLAPFIGRFPTARQYCSLVSIGSK